jgi:hypothetical protein
MAATNYTSRNILWSVITALADGDLVTMTLLYNEGLQRLHDGQGALLGRIATVYSDLVSEATGTKARIVGNVNMTTFNYNDGNALSGLTVIVDENTTTAQTCTFSNAVTGPDVLLTQLTAQCGTNLTWSLNDSGQLVSTCGTTGGTSTIALGAGTAHSTIWPSPTITTPGAGTVNDGASRIGLAAFGSWAGGTLQAFLTTVADGATTTAALAAKVAKAGDVMTGDLQLPRVGFGYTDLGTLVDGAHLTLAATVGTIRFKAPGVDGSYLTITIPTPVDATKRPLIRFRMVINAGNTSNVYFVAAAEAGTGSFGIPPTNYYGSFVGGDANNGSIDFVWNGSKWEIVMAVGDNVSQAGGGTYA